MASDAHSPLLPDPTCLHLTHLEASPRTITAVVTTTTPKACCPVCQSLSDHVHSRYVRNVADLPWMGWEVKLEIHTRRFFCLNLACSRQIFTERLPSVVAPMPIEPHGWRMCSPSLGLPSVGKRGNA